MPKTAQFDIEGFILAGGASRRMGADKATLLLDGVPLAERAARVLAEFCLNVTIVGARLDGRPSVTDVVIDPNGRASIYGLHAALINCRSVWAAVLACDLPFMQAEIFHKLISRAKFEPRRFDIVVPLQPDARPQPLAAVYHSASCLPIVGKMIAKNEFRLASIFQKLNVSFLPVSDLGDPETVDISFLNVNAPEDMQVAKEIADEKIIRADPA